MIYCFPVDVCKRSSDETITGSWTFNSHITIGPQVHLILPSHNDAATPTLSFGDGDSGFFENTDDSIKLSIAGSNKWGFDGTKIQAQVTGGPYITVAAPSGTIPCYTFESDTDTGIGKVAADRLTLIAGGIGGLSVEEGISGATGTHLFVKDLATAPSSNASGGGYLYSEGGALKWRGSGGTVTQLAGA